MPGQIVHIELLALVAALAVVYDVSANYVDESILEVVMCREGSAADEHVGQALVLHDGKVALKHHTRLDILLDVHAGHDDDALVGHVEDAEVFELPVESFLDHVLLVLGVQDFPERLVVIRDFLGLSLEVLKSFVQLVEVDLANYTILVLVKSRLVSDHADGGNDAALLHVERHDSIIELPTELS